MSCCRSLFYVSSQQIVNYPIIGFMTTFHFAPIQGHTDAAYRHFHKEFYGNSPQITYYTPFIRLEHNEVRQRDSKDLTSSLNSGMTLVPQIIFRDEQELNALIGILKRTGCKEINLNMGCPFPLQTGHGRGAATISSPIMGQAVAEAVSNNPDITFSLKMRLGLNDPDEWKILLPFLNDVSLKDITVHPRIARQQYTGDLHLNQFSELIGESVNPVVFNGDIRTPGDIDRILSEFPKISGIMIGRGLLARPSLIEEWTSGHELAPSERKERMLEFHRSLLSHYNETLCGESQIISKIKPFWEYAEDEIGRKAWKAIRKAGNIAKYHSAVAMIK